MNIRTRLDRLEQGQRGPKPIIFYQFADDDGPNAESAARADAIENWEAENGPIGRREPLFIVTQYESRAVNNEVC